MAKAPRNPELIRGIGKYSRSEMYHRRGLWAIKAKNGGKFPVHPKKEQPEAPKVRAPRMYPPEDVKTPRKKNIIRKPTRLRASITPGTILVLLAGRFKGRRVVFLRQLASGLLLVAGPYKVNGVPLRRVNQAYVIATSTKIDVAAIDTAKYEDAYFQKEETKAKKGEGDFFETDKEEKPELSAEKKEDVEAMDAALLPIIEAVPQLKEYLKARFSLKSGDKPHELVF